MKFPFLISFIYLFARICTTIYNITHIDAMSMFFGFSEVEAIKSVAWGQA